MIMHHGPHSSWHQHYSPNARSSYGYRLEYWRNRELFLHTLQMNNLLKRWNNRNSQGNIYLKSGFGLAHRHQNDLDAAVEPAGFTGIAADWENRRFFVSYENRGIAAGDIDHFFLQRARIGIAPYIGDYGDLHSWLMIEIEHEPEDMRGNPVTVTPLLRFFKGTHLVEMGASNKGEVLFNWIIRF